MSRISLSLRQLENREWLHRKVSRDIYGSPSWLANIDLQKELSYHSSCINALNWSENGEYLLSGGDDTQLVIWDVYNNFEPLHVISTGHLHNIFSVKFLPHSDSRKVMSASGDNLVKLFDVELGNSTEVNKGIETQLRCWNCHSDSVKRIIPCDDGSTFLTCSEDGTVRQFDIREPHRCSQDHDCPSILVNYSSYRINLYAMSMSKSNPFYFVVGGTHPYAFLHDRRMVGKDQWRKNSSGNSLTRDTRCVRKFSPNGTYNSQGILDHHINCCEFGTANPNELLVSWNSDYVYLFNINEDKAFEPTFERTEDSPRKLPVASKDVKSSFRQNKGTHWFNTPSQASAPVTRVLRSPYVTTQPRRHTFYQMYKNIQKLFTSQDNGLYESVASGYQNHMVHSIRYVKDAIYYMENYNYFIDTTHFDHDIRNQILHYWRACVSVLVLMDDKACLESNTIIQAGWGWIYDFMNWVIRYLLGISDHWALQMSSPPNEARQNFVLRDPDEHERVLFWSASEMIRGFARIDTNDLSSVRKYFWVHKVLRGCLGLISADINWGLLQPWDRDESEEANNISDIGDSSYTESEHSMSYGEEMDTYDDASEPEFQSLDSGYTEMEIEDELGENNGDDLDDEDYTYVSENTEESEEESDEGPSLLSLRSKKRKSVEPNAPIQTHVKSYYGHCNVETVKDVNFFGLNDEYVMSGSDDGKFFIWDKESTSILAIIQGDSEVVNVLEGHPYFPTIAVSGIDSTIKIFSTENNPALGRSRNQTSNSYKIIAANEMNREQGSRDSYITSRMLSHLAYRAHMDDGFGNEVLDTNACTIM
ncbi:WD repeat protein [Schizosaccharomyces octosporus yFS286]|uniref:WD repeat protein n=1 Tax=Schizosaccharomyces octosporus (strain yFS286) TaxID=483514 RepID=S9PTE2_SCHOY|nr:WD repeat protein [Schizosaccharomyces octosporus yFS286]EPX72411.1 WD repeat protein [Schizosaccharomyces octosporus yFS286]